MENSWDEARARPGAVDGVDGAAGRVAISSFVAGREEERKPCLPSRGRAGAQSDSMGGRQVKCKQVSKSSVAESRERNGRRVGVTVYGVQGSVVRNEELRAKFSLPGWGL